MKTLEEPINYAEVLKNAAQSALAGYESSIAHGGIRDEQQEIWIVSLFSGMQAIAQVAELKQRLAQAERERDAAVHDLEEAELYSCEHCKNYCLNCNNDCDGECDVCQIDCPCNRCSKNDKWQWRGVCEENSKE